MQMKTPSRSAIRFTPGMEFTKRNVLNRTATIYDPLGNLAPYVVRAKLVIQKAWIEAADWDDPLPPGKMEVMVPRIHRSRLDQNSTMFERQIFHSSQNLLHMFSNASEAAYEAAVYIRQEYSDGSITARLIIGSMIRLSPFKAMSIPQFKLKGAVIGLRLTI